MTTNLEWMCIFGQHSLPSFGLSCAHREVALGDLLDNLRTLSRLVEEATTAIGHSKHSRGMMRRCLHGANPRRKGGSLRDVEPVCLRLCLVL